MDRNPTIVFTAPKQVAMEDRPIPEPKEGEVLIKTRCTLISTGTELSILNADYPPDSYWARYGKLPFDPGYDNIGDIVRVGSGVDRSWIGKRVGTYGNHAAFVIQMAEGIRTIHRDIPDEHAVFFTIAEIDMNAIRRANTVWGESVVVYGLGLLGQITVQLLKLCGAMPIFAVDAADSRLSLLPKHGSIVPINPLTQDAPAIVKEATRGRKADIVFEVTGNQNVLISELELLRDQGRWVMMGCPRGKTAFDFHDWCNMPSFTIIGAHNMSHPQCATPGNPWTNARHAELFFDLVADGELDLASLITHRVHHTEALSLYEMLMKDRSQAMGVVLDWTP